MSALMYLWNGTEIIEANGCGYVSSHLYGLQCIDTGEHAPSWRYGEFHSPDGEWTHIPFEKLDPLFRTHLLLLGIT